MSDTLDSTFGLFFQDHDEETCIECGGTEGLQVIGEENYKPVRKCTKCRAAFKADLEHKAQVEAERIREYEWRNAWEEE